MQEVKMYHRNFCSCPSCKLTLNVLQYISLNEKKIQKVFLFLMMYCIFRLKGFISGKKCNYTEYPVKR